MSHVVLSDRQREVLELGLQFIPTPLKIDGRAIQKAVQGFSRQMHVRYFFRGTKNSREIEKFTNKSTWEPPLKNEEIVRELEHLQDQVMSTTRLVNHTPNMTKKQLESIRTLKENKEIIIKPADKGSAVVVMSLDNYEAERQLSNSQHYTPLAESIAPIAAIKISSVLNRIKRMGYISGKQLLYLDPPETPRNTQLYLLPKIHKTRDKWPQNDKMPPGRPIVLDCGSESYRVAEYIDEFLGPLAKSHNSYDKDTTDFIEKVTKLTIAESAMLFSMDFESLYTNIDNTSGLEAVKQAFMRNADYNRPDAEILELLGISLNNNAFQFQGKFYKQIWGTAMGQKYAPNYANIFMAEWERQALNKCPKKPLVYLRYLDDIFGIWTQNILEYSKYAPELYKSNRRDQLR